MAWSKSKKEKKILEPEVTSFKCESCGETWSMYSKNVTASSIVCPTCGKLGHRITDEE